MTARRLSTLQRQILPKMWTQSEHTQGGISTGHLALVWAWGWAKSHVSYSLRTLEARGLITIGRCPGGRRRLWTSLRKAEKGPRIFEKVVNKE